MEEGLAAAGDWAACGLPAGGDALEQPLPPSLHLAGATPRALNSTALDLTALNLTALNLTAPEH